MTHSLTYQTQWGWKERRAQREGVVGGGEKATLAVWPGEEAVIIVEAMSSS